MAFAPGRINLIGEHTDYSAGFVLTASLALMLDCADYSRQSAPLAAKHCWVVATTMVR